jgi:hypothetical protein
VQPLFVRPFPFALRSVNVTDTVATGSSGGLTRARVTAGKARLKVDLAALLLKHVRHLTLFSQSHCASLELTPTVPHRVAFAGKARLGLGSLCRSTPTEPLRLSALRRRKRPRRRRRMLLYRRSVRCSSGLCALQSAHRRRQPHAQQARTLWQEESIA